MIGEGGQREVPFFRLNDQGNAKALVYYYGGEIRYVPEEKHWLVWAGDHWKVSDGREVRNMARETAVKRRAMLDTVQDQKLRDRMGRYLLGCQNDSRVKAAVTTAADLEEVVIPARELDADPWVIGMQGGEVDLRAREWRPGRKESKLTMQLGKGVKWEPEAKAVRWRRFLDEIFLGDQELIEFVQMACGYCLTGSVQEQVMFVCLGEGANGKSTFLGVLYRLFGDYATNTPFTTFDARSRSEQTNDLARLKGKRFVTIVETSEDSYLAEEKVKQATGDDPLTCRFFYKEFFEYMPQFKIWMAANRMPGIKGVDWGIRRRLVVIPFERIFDKGERNDRLKEELLGELSGILQWCLEGLEMWKAGGLRDRMPKRVTEVVEKFREETDLLGQWLDEEVEKVDGEWGKAVELYAAYVEWMRARGCFVKNVTNWGRDLTSKGFEKKRKKDGVWYKGLRLAVGIGVGVGNERSL